MRHVTAWLFCLAALSGLAGARQDPGDRSQPSAPYLDQRPPGKAAERFAPAILDASAYWFHSIIVFSPDLKDAYWHAAAKTTQPGAPGRSGLMMSRYENGRWTAPAPAPFSIDNGGDDAPFISPDGRRLFFLSQRPLARGGKSGPEKIWVTERKAGGWSEPECLASLTGGLAVHWQLSVNRAGDLYFGVWKVDPESGRTLEHDIYCATRENGRYGQPAKLGPDINDPAYRQYSPFIAPDGSYLIFTRVKKVSPKGPALNMSFRRKDGGWTTPVVLNDLLQLPPGAGQATVSPEGKYLFFLRSGMEVFWVDAGFIEELRKTELQKSHVAARFHGEPPEAGDAARRQALPGDRATTR